MNRVLNERQKNIETARARNRNRLIQDRSEVAAQTPKNSFQITTDFNQFYNSPIYRS